ncbi:MAG: zinc-binding alcohol dehydrogenase [Desulfarculaceae bacterium]|nr:zinc-binding alcohol dehydrogenase [Desulfarculaceae bacterium]MCF8118297.1 zinc-binding alcohol dehydrogenase [Desulfarculaceae bacterium]
MKSILRPIALKMPSAWHPYLKAIYGATEIRFQGLISGRSVQHSQRVAFVTTDVADVQDYEFLSPGPGEVMIEVACNAVSVGTEVAQFCGLMPKGAGYWPGYSGAGKVVRVGKGVQNFHQGQAVAGQIKNARHSLVKVPKLFAVPDGVALEEAAFAEIGIIVLQAIRKAAISPGEEVLVIGQGVIGHVATRLARLAGAAPLTACAASESRKSVALSPGGADRFALAGELAPDQADVVIEASGAGGAFSAALDAARPGGRVVVLGSARGQERGINPHRQIQDKELTVIGAHVSDMPSQDTSAGRWTYRQEGELFMALLGSGALSLEPMITHRLGVDRVDLVYEWLSRGTLRPAPVGVVLDWSGQIKNNGQ